jgi:hypothetical protein
MPTYPILALNMILGRRVRRCGRAAGLHAGPEAKYTHSEGREKWRGETSWKLSSRA